MQNKIEYCNYCSRVNTSILKGYLIENKVNALISYFGFAKYKEFNCYHCKKKIIYLTIKDINYFYELDQWRLYFLKFEIQKIIEDIYNFNKEAVYIFDFNEQNIKINVDFKFIDFNIISIDSIDKIDENNYLIIIKWWDFIVETPKHLGVKELFLLKAYKFNNNWYYELFDFLKKDRITWLIILALQTDPGEYIEPEDRPYYEYMERFKVWEPPTDTFKEYKKLIEIPNSKLYLSKYNRKFFKKWKYIKRSAQDHIDIRMYEEEYPAFSKQKWEDYDISSNDMMKDPFYKALMSGTVIDYLNRKKRQQEKQKKLSEEIKKEDIEEQPIKRKRGRPKKIIIKEQPRKRKRGRPRKEDIEEQPIKRKRGRPKKINIEEQPRKRRKRRILGHLEEEGDLW